MTAKRCFQLAVVFAMALLLRGVTAEDPGQLTGTIHFEPTMENGDWNGDGRRDLSDVLNMVNCLFIGGLPPAPCECYHPDAGGVTSNLIGMHCDMDGDGQVNLTDVIYFANWLYLSGPEPMALECEQPFGPSS